jgi:hypothetical protein
MTTANGIGLFQIGISPIGWEKSFDYLPTIISQYANSPTIVSLISSFSNWLDPTANLEEFYDLIWNVDTAQGYGLDVWGRIVGVGRVLNVATGSYFGFTGPSGASGDPYNQSPFYSGQSTTSNFALSDDGFRTLIYAKAAANITDGSIPSINQILLTLFPGRGNCYVVDNEDMTMIYHFNFILTPVEAAIVSQSGVIPRPCGVAATIVQV